MTWLGKLAFPLKWRHIDNRSFEKKRWELFVEDQTMVDVIEDICGKGPLDILLIMGYFLDTILFIFMINFSKY